MPRAMTRLPGEDVQRLVDRAVDARRRCDGAEGARRHDGELDRRHARFGFGRGDARAQLRQLAAERLQARAEHRFGLRVERLGLQPCADASDLAPHGRLAALELVERRLQVVDRDLLRDDAPEPGQARDRVLHLPDRNADGDRGTSLLARGHRRRHDVAAERAGEVESVLRRARNGIGVRDLDGQRCADALRAIGRRPDGGLDLRVGHGARCQLAGLARSAVGCKRLLTLQRLGRGDV